MVSSIRLILVSAASTLALSAPAAAGPADDAMAVVASTMDKFNAGDANAFIAAHTPDATIVDEFAPYQWRGQGSAARWMADYGKDAAARKISGGRVDYGKPVQASGTANSAYIVLPVTYSFTQDGRKMSAKGSMTFVMSKAGDAWKIAGWTYAAPAPGPAR